MIRPAHLTRAKEMLAHRQPAPAFSRPTLDVTLLIASLVPIVALSSTQLFANTAPKVPEAVSGWICHDCSGDGLAIQLPQDWHPIPEFAIGQFGEYTSAQAPGIGRSVQFKYGFQREPIQQWFRTPYALVDIRSGRVPLHQLRATPIVTDPAQKDQSGAKRGALGVFRRLPIGGICFEPERHIIWLNLQHRLPDGRSARCASALFPTQQAVIQLNMYTLESEADLYLDLFERIARSVRLDPSITYREYPLEGWPLLDRLDWSQPTMRYIEIMVAALVFVLFLTSIVLVLRKNRERMKFRSS